MGDSIIFIFIFPYTTPLQMAAFVEDVFPSMRAFFFFFFFFFFFLICNNSNIILIQFSLLVHPLFLKNGLLIISSSSSFLFLFFTFSPLSTLLFPREFFDFFFSIFVSSFWSPKHLLFLNYLGEEREKKGFFFLFISFYNLFVLFYFIYSFLPIDFFSPFP